MNWYVVGGMGATLFIMGLLLKNAYEEKGELEQKLATQASETLECSDANTTNITTITQLEQRIAAIVEQRRIEREQREAVLIERSRLLADALREADRLRRLREEEQDENADCAELASMDLSRFCPATAEQLRLRSRGPGGDGDTDSS